MRMKDTHKNRDIVANATSEMCPLNESDNSDLTVGYGWEESDV